MKNTLSPVGVPPTLGEKNSGYTYIPLDPFAVQTVPGDSCGYTGAKPRDLLDALPDNAVRMLIESFDASGNVSYLVSKAGAKGQSYRVTIDYINADTVNVPVWVAKAMYNTTRKEMEWVDPIAPVPSDYKIGTETYTVTRDPPAPTDASTLHPYTIPVYVGIGLRVSANIYVTGTTANISGIGAIGAQADANRLTGSLTVQTLGINGKSVAAALPIQSELNQTTAENAITAVASIKTLLYSSDVVEAPRVVGLYLPFNGGEALVNALISALSTKRISWPQPCVRTWVQGQTQPSVPNVPLASGASKPSAGGASKPSAGGASKPAPSAAKLRKAPGVAAPNKATPNAAPPHLPAPHVLAPNTPAPPS